MAYEWLLNLLLKIMFVQEKMKMRTDLCSLFSLFDGFTNPESKRCYSDVWLLFVFHSSIMFL